MKNLSKTLIIALALALSLCVAAITVSATDGEGNADSTVDTDTVTLTVDYNDGRGAVTETYQKGSEFYLDDAKIPDTLVYYDTRLGQKAALMLNGELVTDLDALLAPITLDTDKTYVFSGDVIEQYGWMIMTPGGKIINAVTDVGFFAEELVKRINQIEKEAIFNPFKNDIGSTLVADDPSAIAYDSPHSADGYTIRLFDDFEFSETLTFYNLAPTKIVNIDLNGRNIAIASGSFAEVFGLFQFWEMNSDGAVVKVHGSTLDGKIGSYNSALTPPQNTVVTVYNKNYDITVNVISSVKGASLKVDDGASAPLAATYQASTKVGGISKTDYPDVYITLGNSTDSEAIGPDENVIEVQAKHIIRATAYNTYITVQNVNAEVSGYAVFASGGHAYLKNSTVIYDNPDNPTLGMLNTQKGHKETEFTRCNLVSKNTVNLFDVGGFDNGVFDEVWFDDCRIINMYLAMNTQSYDPYVGEEADLEEIIRIMSGCYYDTPYDAEIANSIMLADTRENGYTTYAANVYANESVQINGITYVMTYKVVADEDIITVSWTTPKGVMVKEDKYAKGGVPLYGGPKTVENDTVSKSVISYKNLPASVDADNVFVATVEKLIPAFAIDHTLSLYTNLYHSVVIKRIQGGVDVMTYVTEIKLDGKTVYVKDGIENTFVLDDGETPDNTEDDVYRITFNIKPNEIAEGYELVVSFNTETAAEGTQTVRTTFSVLSYLEYGMEVEQVGSDLYNLYVSLIHYGSAAYSYYGGDAEDAKTLAALAAEHPLPTTVTGGKADASGDNLDVELVFDTIPAYRFYVTTSNPASTSVAVTYTDIYGQKQTYPAPKLLSDDVGLYAEYAVPVYELARGIRVELTMSGIVVDSVKIEISDIYAQISAGGNAALASFVEALYSYGNYAKLYAIVARNN